MIKKQVTIKISSIEFEWDDGSARITFTHQGKEEAESDVARIQASTPQVMHEIRCVVGLDKYIKLDLWNIEDGTENHCLVYGAEEV